MSQDVGVELGTSAGGPVQVLRRQREAGSRHRPGRRAGPPIGPSLRQLRGCGSSDTPVTVTTPAPRPGLLTPFSKHRNQGPWEKGGAQAWVRDALSQEPLTLSEHEDVL